MKICSRCLKLKLFKDYHRSKYGKSGYKSECKSCKSSYIRSPEQCLKDSKNARRWQHENKEYKKSYERAWWAKRRASDPLFKLKNNLRVLLRQSFNNQGYSKTSKTQQLLGADFKTVKAHLEATAIRNYGSYDPQVSYHIDHIVPCSSAKSEQELLALQHYLNLQLLTPEDNLKKSDKIISK